MFKYWLGFLLAVLSTLCMADVPGAPAVMALSSYKGISLSAFEKTVINGFTSAGFTVEATRRERDKDGHHNILMKFKYPLPNGETFAPPLIIVKVDGTLDRSGNCVLCFLRGPYIEDSRTMMRSSWMERYEIRFQVNSKLDKSISIVQADLLKFAQNPAITTEIYWTGEVNTEKDSNSFIGLSPTELKNKLVTQLTNAGFIFIDETNPWKRENSVFMNFIYPYAAGEPVGAKYYIIFNSQLDKNGNCYPCEAKESFDPYQNLPPPGLAGVLDRATISTRFYASLRAAQDQMQTTLSQYLRPRTLFFRLKSSVTLGTPRPAPPPLVVT